MSIITLPKERKGCIYIQDIEYINCSEDTVDIEVGFKLKPKLSLWPKIEDMPEKGVTSHIIEENQNQVNHHGFLRLNIETGVVQISNSKKIRITAGPNPKRN